MVVYVIGDIITGDIVEFEVVVSVFLFVGGLFDFLIGSIGIFVRVKLIFILVLVFFVFIGLVFGLGILDVLKVGFRVLDKDVL